MSTVTLPPSASPSSVQSDTNEQEKFNQPNNGPLNGPPNQLSSSQSMSVAQSSFVVQPSIISQPLAASPAPAPIQTSNTAPSPNTPVATPTPIQSSSSTPSSVPSSSDTYWASAPMSPLAGGQGAQSILDSANKLRQAWMSNTTKFTWSPTLANNSYMTATQPVYDTEVSGTPVPHNEGGGNQMGHELYPGSSSQCIIYGDDQTINGTLTPFETAFLGWICEEPNEYDMCIQQGYIKASVDTGHADIIKGTVSQIGCYYMNSTEWNSSSGLPPGMWTCDFQEPGGQEE